MADNFPLSTWDGVNSPWQNIQNWRVYGHDGSGTSNTGFRNYGATGVNSSSGAGTRSTWFKDGNAVQRTQFRSPNAGVRQRFYGGEQIRSFNSKPVGDIVNRAVKRGQELFNDPDTLASMPQSGFKGKVARGMQTLFNNPNIPKPVVSQPATPQPVFATDPTVLGRQQAAKEMRASREAGTFQPAEAASRPTIQTPSSFAATPSILTPEQRSQMAAQQRQELGLAPREAAQQPEAKVLTPLQQRSAEMRLANEQRRSQQAPPAEQPPKSRGVQRARKSAIGVWGQTRINESLGLE